MTDRGEPTPEHEHYLNLARTLPKIPVNDPRLQAILAARAKGDKAAEDEITGPMSLWRNNFWAVFSAMRSRRLDPESQDGFGQVYLDGVAKSVGSAWDVFVSGNTELLAEIDEEIGRWDSVSELMWHPIKSVYNTHTEDRAERTIAAYAELDEATGHPLGVNGVYYAATDRLNPLLKRAWQAMEEVGVPAWKFASGTPINFQGERIPE